MAALAAGGRTGAQGDGLLKYALLAPALVVIAATLGYPLVQSFWYSLHDWNLGQQSTIGSYVGAANYVQALTDDPEFWNSVRVTLVFTVASVVLTLSVALALAMLLAGGRAIEVNVRTLLVIPFAMSPALLGISWRFLLNPEFGAVDAVLKWLVPPLRGQALLAEPTLAMCALVLVDVWHWAPYFMLTFVGALASLPQDTIDAAEVDGASRFRAFFQVILPQLRPVLAITILLKTIFSLKMLDQVVTMTSGGPGNSTTTLPYSIYETAFRFFDLGYGASVAYLLAAVMLVLAVIYSRMVTEKRA